MVQYTKPWLSVEEQVERLVEHGLDVGDRDHATAVLGAIGYYRLTGYLYSFRKSEQYADDDGRMRTRALRAFRPGTSLAQAEAIIDFDRQLRMLVLDGLERIEVAVRAWALYSDGPQRSRTRTLPLHHGVHDRDH